jgi:hypothetical protein
MRVLELERQVEQLTAENVRLRAQLRGSGAAGAVTATLPSLGAAEPLDIELERRAVATEVELVPASHAAAAAVAATVEPARVVLVGDSVSAPMFVMPTPPRKSAAVKRTARIEPTATTAVDVVNLSDDDDDDSNDRRLSPPTKTSAGASAKRPRTIIDVAVVASLTAGNGDVVGGDEDDDLRLPSQMPPRAAASPVVVVPVDFRRGNKDKEDVLQNRLADATAPSKPFRYVEPVLNRAERRKLAGRECDECAEFYTAVCEATGRAPDRDAFVQAHSRHREVCTPPPRTPEGFWTVGFASPDSVRSDATTQEK